MNRITSVNRTGLNSKHYEPLTEEQKRHNIEEAQSKLFQIVLDRIIADGGLKNANQYT